MPTEFIALIATQLGGLVTIGIAMFAGFAWIVRRIDAVEERLNRRIDDVEERLNRRIDDVEVRLSRRIDEVEEKLTRRIDEVEEKLTRRIDEVAHEVAEVKVSVARWEGPLPRLLMPR